MNKKTLTGWFLVVALICGGGWACSKPQALQFLTLQNFSVQSLSAKESVISADVRFYNPNNFRIRLRSAEMDISVNNNALGRSVLDTNMAILARDTFSLPVQLKVDLSGLISNSISLLLSKEVNVKVDGKAKLGRAGIFFNFPFTYQGKQKLPLFP